MDRAGARVSSLERDIQFLQQTHKSTLEKLHEEIDHLKRANKGESDHSKPPGSFLLGIWTLSICSQIISSLIQNCSIS